MPSSQPIASEGSRSHSILWFGLVLSLMLLGASLLFSITSGVAEISYRSIYEAFTAFDGSTEQLIVRTVRVPRSLIAMMVGASLSVAGAIMQGLTRNPLADPGILGINAGATFAVVATTFFWSEVPGSVYTASGLLGAILSAVTIYMLSSFGQGGVTPIKLTIAGAVLTAFLASLTTTMLILNTSNNLEEIRFWLAGSVARGNWDLLWQVCPYTIVGLLTALLLGRPITIATLGEDVATGLGLQMVWVKVVAAVCVVCLAGSSVAIAGPIGFIGLAIPHIARFLVGVDYRWILPYAAVLGGILLLLADVTARLLIKPQELPAGVVTALIGAPFFIYLALWQVKR